MARVSPKIRMLATDHEKLTRILARLPPRLQVLTSGLEEELDRAEIVPDASMPKDVVTMLSDVVYEDLDTGKVARIRLAYPSDADLENGRLSVLAPVGSALLGLKVGQTIRWPLPNGRTGRLRVSRLTQPY